MVVAWGEVEDQGVARTGALRGKREALGELAAARHQAEAWMQRKAAKPRAAAPVEELRALQEELPMEAWAARLVASILCPAKGTLTVPMLD
jgi:hypothetical protein